MSRMVSPQFAHDSAPMLVLLATTILIAACSGSNSSGRTPVEPSQSQQSADYYRDGQFVYDGQGCAFVPADHSTRYSFECGLVLVGLKAGLKPSDVADLTQAVSAEVLPERVVYTPDRPTMVVRVPAKSEREAILRLSADARIRYAALNITGPASASP